LQDSPIVGYFDESTNTIYIKQAADNPVSILVHELSHFVYFDVPNLEFLYAHFKYLNEFDSVIKLTERIFGKPKLKCKTYIEDELLAYFLELKFLERNLSSKNEFHELLCNYWDGEFTFKLVSDILDGLESAKENFSNRSPNEKCMRIVVYYFLGKIS